MDTAIVIGLGTNGLAVVRALATKKVRTLVLLTEADKLTPYYHTRYGEKIILPNLNGATVAAYINSLKENSVLFPTLEHIVTWLSANREVLHPRHKLLLPEQNIVSMMMDKEQFDCFAQKHGLLQPKTWLIKDRHNTDTILTEGVFPFIVKPSRKLYVTNLPKASIVNDETTLKNAIKLYLAETGECLVQEFIPGNDRQIFFCMQYINENGELLASFTGRKIRQWHPLSGGTASCEPANVTELHKETTDIFKKAGLWGICSMEYKLDQRDDQFYCIEPTVCRTDFQEYVAVVNGINIPYIAYASATGKPVKPVIYNKGKKAWMHFTNDRLAAEEIINNKELNRIQWLYSLRHVRSFDCFSLVDPGPMLFYGKTILKNRLAKL